MGLQIKKEKRWILWEPRPKANGKTDKIPMNPQTGIHPTSVTDFTKAVTFDEAKIAAKEHGLEIGVLLGKGLSCIDLDNCVQPDGILEEADNIIIDMDSYTEFSPSGLGLHIFYYGEKPGPKCRMKMNDFEIEIYEKDRFMTFTESLIYGEHVEERQDAINKVYYQTFGTDSNVPIKEYGHCENPAYKLKYALSHDTLLNTMWQGTRSDDDESRNDLAIIGKLCYWLDRDAKVIYDVLLTSPYFGSKSSKHKEKLSKRYKNYFIPSFEKANNELGSSAWDWQKIQFVNSEETMKKVDGSTISMEEFEEENTEFLVDDPNDFTPDDWVYQSETTGKYKVFENKFTEWLVGKFSLMCINGVMYTTNGEIPDEYIKHKIQGYIKPYLDTGLATKTNNLFEAVKNECYKKLPRPKINEIHIEDHTVDISGDGHELKAPKFTINRINVKYDEDLECPLWLKFLDELIEPEYVPILQEFMGYCLTPTNVAQAACFIIGNGGEGKSIVTQVMQKILGKNQITAAIHKLSKDFMLGNLENKLCLLDDDVNLGALDDTSTFKQIVTSNGEMLLERKNKQHHSAQMYAKIFACGNGNLRSRYDKSDGFYRRLLLINCKPKDPDRVDDKLLHLKILKETNAIFNWMLVGLERLMSHGWYFTESEKVTSNIEALKEEGENIRLFLKDDEFVSRGIKDLTATTMELYDSYALWCEETGFDAMKKRAVSSFMLKHLDYYDLKDTNKIKRKDVYKRGYRGIQTKRNTLNYSGHEGVLQLKRG